MQSNGDPSRAIGTPGWSQTPERFFNIKNEYVRSNLAISSIPNTSGPPAQLCCYSCLAVCLSQVLGVEYSLHPPLTQIHLLCRFWARSISQPWCLGIFFFGIDAVVSELALSINSIYSLKKQQQQYH